MEILEILGTIFAWLLQILITWFLGVVFLAILLVLGAIWIGAVKDSDDALDCFACFVFYMIVIYGLGLIVRAAAGI